MRLFVAVTDYDWFRLHAARPNIEEVNFWRPSPKATFKALYVGEPLLFKLHHPRNYITGGGFFTKFVHLPLRLAWDTFGQGNGVTSYTEARNRIAQYRRAPLASNEDPDIGCIILSEPFFFPEKLWIAVPSDFSLNIVSGKGYSTDEQTGRALWAEVTERLQLIVASRADLGTSTIAAIKTPRYGNPVPVKPRLGQGAFRVVVTDAYERRCAVTRERTLPVLEAAHIKPYSVGGVHDLPNGLLLRSDLHRLFDLGYMSIDPDERRLLVSSRIREEFQNGREYYALHRKELAGPVDGNALPSRENLAFHYETYFRR
jgi:putative restriction endonuclease